MGKDTGEIIEIDDDQLAATFVAGKNIKEVKRARTKKVLYKADDPKTKENEAYE